MPLKYDDYDWKELPDNVKEAAKKLGYTKKIWNADKERFGNLQIGLKNLYLLGKDNYPTTIADLLKVLNNYKPEWTSTSARPPKTNTGSGSSQNCGHSFLQAIRQPVHLLQGTNNSFYLGIVCHLCGIKGHYQTHYPVVTNSSGSKLSNIKPKGSSSSQGENTEVGMSTEGVS